MIDNEMKGDRDASMNEILNTIDGIDTKGKAIVTILTTNHEEKIHPGFLRAGRIDSAIYMGPPDHETAQRFVKLYAGKLMSPDVDLDACGRAFEGFVPAFIAEAIQKAKRFVIHRTKSANIDGLVTTDDLVTAAGAMKNHRAMVENRKAKTEAELIADALRTLVAKCYVEPGGAPSTSDAPQPDHRTILGGVRQVHDLIKSSM